MKMIRRNDRDDVNAVGTLRFRGGHLGEAAVGAIGRDVQIGSGLAATLGIGRERGGDELISIVDARGYAMDGADEAAGAAAYHTETEATCGCRCCGCVDSHLRSSMISLPAAMAPDDAFFDLTER